MRKTFASFAFGCRVNAAEKEELDVQLLSLGYSYDVNDPSIYIINTCAVTQKAEREARQFIYQTRKKYPKTKIIITGCSATKWIKEEAEIKEADWMVGNKNKEYIALMISKIKYQKFPPQRDPASGGTKKQVTDQGKRRASEKIVSEGMTKYLPSKRLLVKIQDGCQRYCTYCIVPYLRGTPKSERIKNLELRIKNYENEVKEVILAAINTEAYGLDTGESFIDLLDNIMKHTKVERVSLGSIHPWSINNDFFNFYKRILPQKRLVNFFHIPLQSGSNKILDLMKRGYTREEFIEKLNSLSRIDPFSFIGTDIIVGFLEETDRDFEDTYNFLKDSPISRFHIFRFSKREKTAAFYMAKRLKEPSPQVKIKRARILTDLGRKKYRKFLKRHIGKSFSALFLERRIENYQEALLDNQIPALIKTEKNLTGQIKDVGIEKIKNDRLIGK